MSTKAKGTSATQKLANLAKKRGARFEHVATEFLIERLVRRLVADKKLASLLVFKGGFVGLRVYNSSRYTVDLDALLRKSNLEATLKLTREAAEADLGDGVWFRFENQVDLEAQGEYGGIRQAFRAGFGEVPKKLLKAQTINFDLGIGDPVSPVSSKMVTLLWDEELSWSIYPIETIIAEKLHALVARGDLNSRSKDVFDLVAFLPKANAAALQESLANCFKYRETALPGRLSDVVKELNTKTLERGWVSAVASVQDAPKFQDTFAKLISLLEQFDG
ncbi:MAG: nucleotidyl transferase AbiEii/AbiGii toxin family protein [Bdellovibrionaceae bacterium]|nr:nucleotidyl transferase AbiEii/AbiGii toxin family protein [Pseudobdellovibrionaceae bacterium]